MYLSRNLLCNNRSACDVGNVCRVFPFKGSRWRWLYD